MNKKTFISLCVFSGLLLIGGVAFADELKESLELYLQDSSLDLCGREFDKILFSDINSVSTNRYADAELIEKLKFIIDDIKTLPLQTKCIYKIINQKPNTVIYGSLSGCAGLKASIGEKEFNKLIIKLFKLILK